MAIAMLSVGVGNKGKAAPHAQYIAREGKYEKENDSLEKLEHTGHGNMPKWAEHDPNYFWQSADEHERKNGSTYREHVIALPRELDVNERHELIKDWIAQEIGDKYAYQYAIHNPPAMDGKEQPHCHLMFSECTRDSIDRDPDQYFKRYNSKNPEKGGAKKANTGLSHADRKADLLAQRERWEQTCNKHLELAGSRKRISMKSLKEQGINRKPIDLTMRQLKDPKIKGAYQIMLDSENEYIALKKHTRKFMNPTKELAEQEKQAAVRLLKLEVQQHAKEQEKAHEQERPTPRPPQPKPIPQPQNDAKIALIEKLENRHNPYEQGAKEYFKAVREYASQLQQKEFAKIKAEIKAIKDKPPVEPTKGLFTNKKTHQSNQTAYAIELRTHQQTIENKERELVSKQGISVSEYSRYEHHQAIKEQRPDLAQASYEATAWDKETQRLQQELEQLNKPQEQEQVQTKGKDIDW